MERDQAARSIALSINSVRNFLRREVELPEQRTAESAGSDVATGLGTGADYFAARREADPDWLYHYKQKSPDK